MSAFSLGTRAAAKLGLREHVFHATLTSHCIVQESVRTGRTACGAPAASQPGPQRCRWMTVTDSCVNTSARQSV